ncbi:MAG: SDR family NAD(P)-dependent oxidoreductase [Lachnospiraceae bacterium]|nr:SDR family NAD(P)-dependent oxidoreductase [Lachnospiraceae bacterium]
MRKIILTGSTGGVGYHLAQKIISQNIGQLFCVYRNEQKYDKLFGSMSLNQTGYLLKEKDDFSDLVNLLNNDGSQDEDIVLILNAFSIMPITSIGAFKDDEIEEMIYGNITRNVLILNRVVDYCKKKEIGLRVINLDSAAADHPFKGWSNYCASKAYMNVMLTVLASENPDFQIVSFDPGVVDTNMQAQIRSVDKSVFNRVNTFVKYKELGVLRKPEDVADHIINRYVINWDSKELREKIE